MSKYRVRRLCYISVQPAARFGNRCFVSPYTMHIIRYPSAFFPEVVLVAAHCAQGDLNDKAKRTDISDHIDAEVRFLPTPRGRLWRWMRQIPTLWTCVGNADLVCVNLPEEASFLAAMMCRLRRKPLLVQVLGDWAEAVSVAGSPTLLRKAKACFAEFMQRFPVRSARLVFTQGQALFDKCASVNPLAVKSPWVHSTITEEAFFSRPVAKFHEPLRMLSVCSLDRRKGLHVLLRAVKLLSLRGINIDWQCVGRGESQTELQEMGASLGILGSVRFVGYVPHGPQLFRLYRESDVFVLPSYHEGVPNALLEAMAHSLPVVSTTVGSIPQTIRNGHEGILIEPGQAESLANAITQLIENPHKAWQMGQAAYQRAQGYRAGAMASFHRGLIEECIGRIDHANSPRQFGIPSADA